MVSECLDALQSCSLRQVRDYSCGLDFYFSYKNLIVSMSELYLYLHLHFEYFHLLIYFFFLLDSYSPFYSLCALFLLLWMLKRNTKLNW